MVNSDMYLSFQFLIIFSASLGVLGYECYVCNEQGDNEGKCVNTVEPCAHDEDYCLSEIKWGSKPFWEIGAKMQYFISKSCATKEVCTHTINKYLPYCDHIHWKDWKCAECCKGDRCNYYITLGSQSVKSSTLFVLLSASVAVIGYFLQ